MIIYNMFLCSYVFVLQAAKLGLLWHTAHRAQTANGRGDSFKFILHNCVWVCVRVSVCGGVFLYVISAYRDCFLRKAFVIILAKNSIFIGKRLSLLAEPKFVFLKIKSKLILFLKS